MPLDPTMVSTVAQVAAPLATAGLNAGAQVLMNKSQRQWNEKMYQLQRGHALQDWQMQQDYNTPTAQMKRLQDAGLNPNLIYGNGGASTQAQPVRSTESKSWNPQAPQIPNILSQYQDAQVRQAQVDLVKEQIKTQQATQQAIASQNVLRLIQGESVSFNTEQKKRLADTAYTTAQEFLRNLTIRNLQGETSVAATKLGMIKTGEEIQTMQVMRDPKLRETLQRINNMSLSAENIKASTIGQTSKTQLQNIEYDLKVLQKNLMEKGIYPGDNVFARLAIQYLADPEMLKRDIENLKKIGDNVISGVSGKDGFKWYGPFGFAPLEMANLRRLQKK